MIQYNYTKTVYADHYKDLHTLFFIFPMSFVQHF